MTASQVLHPKRTKVIACATVIEEMQPHMPADIACEVLDFGLHVQPDNLKQRLQAAINASSQDFDTIILGYGLCSMAAVGLQSNDCTLVIPKVDDCIALFLGSGQAYTDQAQKEPGTYYRTKGWIEVSDTLLDDYQRWVGQYGEQRAGRVIGAMLKHYTRLVYIDTGWDHQGQHRAHAKTTAYQFNLRFEVIPGSDKLIKKLLYGPWDDEIIVAPPGHTIHHQDFRPVNEGSGSSES